MNTLESCTRIAARPAGLGVLLVLMAGASLTTAAAAQGEGHPVTSIEVRQAASSMEDRIGAVIDPQLEFTDERGYPFRFQQVFPGKSPVILVLGYYGCPDMCGQVIHGMVETLNDVDLQPVQDYLIVNVSIDPRETAATAKDRKSRFVSRLAKVGCDEGWRFLTGAEKAIKQLADCVGFRYFWAEHDNRFDHPPALLFVTPQGKLSRVITGTTFEPGDVRLAIVEAGEGKIGTFWDKFQLSCLTWDPKTRTYSLAAMTVMRIGGVITLLAIGAMIITMIRRERRPAATAGSTPPATPPPAAAPPATGRTPATI